MQVHRFTTLQELAPYAEAWDRLAGEVPFRGWAWQSTWWRHYGPADEVQSRRARLCVLGVFDHTDQLVGIAPWYLEVTATRGRVLRMLGSGEVCSDHLSLLCHPGLEDCVAEAVAEWLTAQHSHRGEPTDRPAAVLWDRLELDGVDADESAVVRLTEHLAAFGNTVRRRPGMSCWQIDLPTCWDAYVSGRSRSVRRHIRRAERVFFRSGRAVLRSAQTISEVPQAMDILIDLHQRRWRSLGKPGCFASRRFAEFHQEVAKQLFLAGCLQLHWLEVDGRPAAAEYQMSGGGILYVYQAGMDPELLRIGPGRLITIALVRWAIEAGYRRYDFLRGDEPYKAWWGATRCPGLSVQIVPNASAARLRHCLWLAGDGARQWIRRGLRLVGSEGQWK